MSRLAGALAAGLVLAASAGAGVEQGEPLYPLVSPDGTHLAWVDGATQRIIVAFPDGTARRVLASAPTGEGFSHLAWTEDGVVADSNFTLFRLGLDGAWRKLAPAGFGFATGGGRVASGPERGAGRLVVTDLRSGRSVRMGDPKVNNSSASFAPDGRRVAWSAAGSLWVAPVGGTPRRLAAHAGCPVWSPDGRSIAFLRPPGDLRVMPAQGGAGRLLLASAGACGATAWSPDSSTLAVVRTRLVTVDVASGTVTRTPPAVGAIAGGFAYSPDHASLYATARPFARGQAGDRCTSLWRLDAGTLRGRIVVRGCP